MHRIAVLPYYGKRRENKLSVDLLALISRVFMDVGKGVDNYEVLN